MSTYQAVAKLSETLEINFAPFDQKVADGTVQYLKTRFQRLQDAIIEFAPIRHDVWKYYPKLYEAAGGKGNYQLIQYGVGARVEELIRKSEKAKAEKRNFRIAKKLEESGITEVKSAEVNHSYGGFNGVFEVETDKGSKKVIVDTIFACGEINAPHFRVLVKVK